MLENPMVWQPLEGYTGMRRLGNRLLPGVKYRRARPLAVLADLGKAKLTGANGPFALTPPGFRWHQRQVSGQPGAMVLVMTFAAGGMLAGALGRLLLRRLNRGAEVRAGWCEAACSALWAVLGAAVGGIPVLWLPVMSALSWFAVMLTATDLLHGRLPDALTLPAYPIFGVLLAVAGTETLVRALAGAALFWSLHATVHFLSPTSMGGGDVKLSGSLGAILGAVSWFALAVALTLAAVITLGLRTISLGRWRDRVPHGPGLLAATWLLAFLPGLGR